MLFLSAGIILILLLTSCSALMKNISEKRPPDSPCQSIIRVNVTQQGYNFHLPWQQRSPVTRTAIGVVIKGPRVLVTSEIMANHRYVEFEKADSGEKSRAELEVVDYEANLALLKPLDTRFLEDMRPLELMNGAVQGDLLSVWQVKPNGIVTPAVGTITSIELVEYPYKNYFISYRLNSSLQYRFRNFTLPVVRNGKLAGLLKRYNAKVQTIDVIPAPVIKHFLKDAADGEYMGFPLSGIKIVSARDPQFRQYAGILGKTGGVYVEKVVKDSAAEKAGIQQGDIIMEIAGFPIDSRGNYAHQVYGKMAASHLTRCEFHVDDRITYKVFRRGKVLTINVIADHKPHEAYLVPQYIIDTAPRYYILGGFVLQELSASYLREYGKNWTVRAPVHLVYYEANQDSFKKKGLEKIVFLSRVMPTSYTVGYGNLSNLVIKQINNSAIGRLEDVPQALKTPVDGFHKVEFEQRPKVIYLSPEEIPKIDIQIRKRYNLPALYNLCPFTE